MSIYAHKLMGDLSSNQVNVSFYDKLWGIKVLCKNGRKNICNEKKLLIL